MKILVIDVGGTNIKVKVSTREEIRKFPSGSTMTGKQMADQVLESAKDWTFDAVTIGFPGPVVHGKIRDEPVNLGSGWVGYDFEKLFGKPVKILNDAAMQALGCYEGGRMLFLGLGTGLGATLIIDNVVAAMELAHLPYKKGKSFEQYVGNSGMKRLGKKRWETAVFDVVKILKNALVADYVVLGGGNVKKLDRLPPGTQKGDNSFAFIGGARLWDSPDRQKRRTPGTD
ncbi:MAG: ROK family protein [Gemmataceae bacterium]|nr:ROK family protein [Gemmataceae bacterium]